MPYEQHNIAAITDIPALVGAFADSLGFDVDDTTPTQPIVTHPTYMDALSFQMVASIGGTNNQEHRLRWDPLSGPSGAAPASIYSPRLNGTTANPSVPSPTKVHLFGDLTPEPYIIVTVEYAFNWYRHLYYGYLEKIGDFEGGEVISAGNVSTATFVGSATYRDVRMQYMFQGNQTRPANDSGGVRVLHDDSPADWHQFQVNGFTFATLPGGRVVGGFGDNINTGYLARSKSAFNGTQILTPINLYGTKNLVTDSAFLPLGRPAGIRLVHMEEIDPAAIVEMDGENWHCFPMWRKSSDQNMAQASGGSQWRASETSYWVGLAMREGAPS